MKWLDYLLHTKNGREYCRLLKWPLAIVIWSLAGMLVSVSNWPNVHETVTLGHYLAIVLSMSFFGLALSELTAWSYRHDLIRTRLALAYQKRLSQLYYAGTKERKELRKKWEASQ